MKAKNISRAFIILLTFAFALCGCQKTPDKDIIIQKKGIAEVANENSSNTAAGKPIKDIVNSQKHSSFVVDDEKLKMNITVDADVYMPDVSKVPIVEMKRDDIPESRLKEITKLVFGDNPVVPEDGGSLKYEFGKKNQYVVIGKAKDGIKKTLYILNFPEESSANYEKTGSIIPLMVNPNATDENTDNKCKVSKKDAIALTKDMVEQLGIDKQYKLASVTYMGAGNDKENNRYTAKGYRIRYKRITHGIMETDDATTLKFNGKEENATASYGYEYVEFVIDDDGCELWNWMSPMKEGKILSENVNLLSYDKILDIFKKQVKYSNATGEQIFYQGDIAIGKNDTKDGFKAKVTKIIFGYMRVKNKGEDTYSLVPVWDFQGDINQGTSILTINAIDGTVIDRRLGY